MDPTRARTPKRQATVLPRRHGADYVIRYASAGHSRHIFREKLELLLLAIRDLLDDDILRNLGLNHYRDVGILQALAHNCYAGQEHRQAEKWRSHGGLNLSNLKPISRMGHDARTLLIYWYFC
jgi:hypothetical protein